MSPMIRLLTLLGSLTLAACQMASWKEPPPSHLRIPTTQTCDGTSCTVKVDYEREGVDCDTSYCYPIAPVHVIVAPPRAGDQPSITMVWTLPSNSPATFADNGIKFRNAKSGFDCHLGTRANPRDRHAFTCTNHRQVPDQRDPEEAGWKYSIRLDLASGGGLKILDPWVVNR